MGFSSEHLWIDFFTHLPAIVGILFSLKFLGQTSFSDTWPLLKSLCHFNWSLFVVLFVSRHSGECSYPFPGEGMLCDYYGKRFVNRKRIWRKDILELYLVPRLFDSCRCKTRIFQIAFGYRDIRSATIPVTRSSYVYLSFRTNAFSTTLVYIFFSDLVNHSEHKQISFYSLDIFPSDIQSINRWKTN